MSSLFRLIALLGALALLAGACGKKAPAASADDGLAPAAHDDGEPGMPSEAMDEPEDEADLAEPELAEDELPADDDLGDEPSDMPAHAPHDEPAEDEAPDEVE